MRLRSSQYIIAFLAVVSVVSALSNFTIDDVGNNRIGVETRRQKKLKQAIVNRKGRSTSSSSNEKSVKGSRDKDGTSLEMTSDSSSASSSGKKKDKKKYQPKSSEERKGWRKWHRKCTPCPDAMVLKWRDPRVNWICGGYQRARRSFKSACLMRYRNCQDGTMFVKLYSHRCKNDTDKMDVPHGQHFFYDYKADLSDESSNSKSSSEELTISTSVSSSSSSSEVSKETRRMMRATGVNSTTAAKITEATTTTIKT